jgi:porphobilinogen deaminase
MLGLGVVDATLLALAGLKRLSMEDVIAASEIITWDTILPAVAQGMSSMDMSNSFTCACQSE